MYIYIHELVYIYIYIDIDIIVICHTLMCWLFFIKLLISIFSMNSLFLFATKATLCKGANTASGKGALEGATTT